MPPPDVAPDVAALRCDEVGKVFDDGTRALAGVSLAVNPGELVTLVGPSGCGKTTILRLAAGLDQPTTGTVAVPASAHTSVVFQDPTLLEWRTALANVELLGELRAVPRQERRDRALAALESVGLSDALAKRPRQLSGGMRMRVSLARALTTQPDLALFDEPFGALDELTRLSLQNLLQDLITARTFAGLFITHSVSEAVYLSDRILVMGRGYIAAEVQVPFPRPRDPELRYTAEFAELAGTVSRHLSEAMAESTR